MTRCLILSGIASALLSPVFMQAQAHSSGEGALPNANNSLRKPREPLPAAHKPVFVPTGMDLKASIGYANMSLSMPSATRLNLSGVNAAFIAESLYFGYTVEYSYVRAVNVFGTNRHADVLSYLGGPILYPVSHGRIRAYVHGLFGGTRVTGTIPTSDGNVTGFVNKFSRAVGGGAEYQISRSFAFQGGAAYQHTYYYALPSKLAENWSPTSPE
jgi:hypothetical protein